MRLTPICVKCGREMLCAKNDVVVYHPIEFPTGGPIQEGNIVYTDRLCVNMWQPGDIDFVALGDKYRCPDCGTEVVVGVRELMMATLFSKWTQKDLKRIVTEAEEVIEIMRK